MLCRLFAFSLLVVFSHSALACSVPVFRYALEQWQADSLPLVVFYRGELTAEQQALVDRIEPQGIDAKYVANTWVRKVNLDEAQDKDMLELWTAEEKANADPQLPWMVLLPPAKAFAKAPVMGAEFNAANVDSILSSPAREEMSKRILKGDSVVWMLLDGGSKEKDDAAEEILKAELKRLEGVIEAPEIDPKDIADGSLSIDPEELKIKFSYIRVSRDDPKEKAFVEMLLSTEPDLRDSEFEGQPMALPVFGRARSLYALIGKGINAETIEDASRFLTGACQCTIKAQNPGVDLLTSVEWDKHIDVKFKPDTSIPTLVGLGGFEAKSDEGSSDAAETDSNTETELTENNGTQKLSSKEATASADSHSAEAMHDEGAAETPRGMANTVVSRVLLLVFGVMVVVVFGLSRVVGRS